MATSGEKKKKEGMPKRVSKFTPGRFKVEVRRSRTGLGLFAAEEIPKGLCIVEYVGRVIKGREEYTSNSKYLFQVHSRLTIDGRPRMNIAGYINHSCRPNAEIEVRKARVFIMSIRKIPAGTEIWYDYGKEYFDAHLKKHGCRCEKCAEKGKANESTKPMKKK